jgi:hypothetical protein
VGIMPEGGRILTGDTRHGKSPTIPCGCLRRYSGIHKPEVPRHTGTIVFLPIQVCSCSQKTLPEFLSVLSVRYNSYLNTQSPLKLLL